MSDTIIAALIGGAFLLITMLLLCLTNIVIAIKATKPDSQAGDAGEKGARKSS